MIRSFFRRLKLVWYWLWPTFLMVGILLIFIFVVYNRQTREYDLKPGLENDSEFFQGLFGPEKNDKFAYTWTRPQWSIDIPDLPQNPYKLTLSLLSLKQQQVTILDSRGNELQQFTPGDQLQEYSFTIPAQAINQHHLQLSITSPGFVSGDKRQLGVLLTRLMLVQQKPKGIALPSSGLAESLVELGVVVSWLLTGLYLLSSAKKIRPRWPFLVGTVTVILYYLPVLFFPTYDNEFDLRDFLDVPLFGLCIVTAGVYFYLIAPRILALVTNRHPGLLLTSNKFHWAKPGFKRNWGLFAGIGMVGILYLFFAARFEIMPYPFDIDLYHKYGNLVVMDRAWPFRNFYLEYPPFAVAFFMLPSLIENFFRPDLPYRYLLLFQLQFFFIAAGFLFLMWKLLRKLYPVISLNGRMWVLNIAVFLSSYYIFGRFDIGPTFLVALAFYLIFSARPTLGGAILGLGAAAKIYPALFVPLLVIYFWRGRQERENAFRICAGFGIANLIVTLPFIIFGWNGLLNFLEFHGQRGIQIESYYASLIWLGNKFGFTNISTSVDHGSDNLVSDWSPLLSQLSTYMILGGLVAFYLLLWWVASSGKQKKLEPEWLLQAALIVTVWFIISNKVLSAQYMIWLLPFVPFIKFNKVWLLWGALLLSTIAYPFMGKAVHNLDWQPLAILLARNIVLLVFFGWQLWEFFTNSRNLLRIDNRPKDRLNDSALMV